MRKRLSLTREEFIERLERRRVLLKIREKIRLNSSLPSDPIIGSISVNYKGVQRQIDDFLDDIIIDTTNEIIDLVYLENSD